MSARHIPYAVGLFTLFPFAFWLAALWFLPGPTHGLASPVSNAFFLTSVPLVAWFFLANLSFLSNSIAGEPAYARPRTRWVRKVIGALPAAALAFGFVAAAYLIGEEKPVFYALFPALMGVVLSLVIQRGEAARRDDIARTEPGALAAPASVAPAEVTGAGIGAVLLRVVGLVPVLGWMIREAVAGGLEARAWFTLNVGLSAVIAVLLFGYPALITIALGLVVFAFGMLIALTRD